MDDINTLFKTSENVQVLQFGSQRSNILLDDFQTSGQTDVTHLLENRLCFFNLDQMKLLQLLRMPIPECPANINDDMWSLSFYSFLLPV